MRKAKKLIVLALTCIMLLGSTLVVHAAECSYFGGHEGSVKYTNGYVGAVCHHCKHCGVHLAGNGCFK